jgi:hypothetical protein
MRILVVCDKDNLETQLHARGFKTLLPNFQCDFVTSSEAESTKSIRSTSYQILMYIGKVDTSDTYEVIRRSALTFSGPIIGYSIWVNSPDIVTKKKIDLFDHIYVEFKELLSLVQRRLGTTYVHWSPHIAFLKPLEPISNKSSITSKPKVLIFLNIEKGQNLITEELDLPGNKFTDQYSITYLTELNLESIDTILQQIGQYDYCICASYISHVLAWISHIPFISISKTDKVKFLLQDLRVSFPKIDKLVDRFHYMVEHSTEIKNALVTLHSQYHLHLKACTMKNILNWITKRKVPVNPVQYPDLEMIYQSTRTYMIKKTNLDPDVGTNQILDVDLAFMIADLACTKVTGTPGSRYLHKFINILSHEPTRLKTLINTVADQHLKESNFTRININYLDQGGFNGMHRWGWEGVLGLLQQFSAPNGVLLDTFLDRTFCWCYPTYKEFGLIPYDMPWAGIIHHPFETTFTAHNAITLFNNPDFISSLHTCRVLVCLTNYLAQKCRARLLDLGFPDVPVISVLHPTEMVMTYFNPQSYLGSPVRRLIQVGAWYRNTFSIYVVPVPSGYVKTALKGLKMNNYYPDQNTMVSRERIENFSQIENKWLMFCCKYIKDNNYLVEEFKMTMEDVPPDFFITINRGSTEDSVVRLEDFNPSTNTKYQVALEQWFDHIFSSVQIINQVDNSMYDQIITTSVVFLDLIDCSASNTILECIARRTPILVRRLEPVIEYLGDNYPLYYTQIDQIPTILTEENIEKASLYMEKRLPLVTSDAFTANFRNKILKCLN